MPFTLAPSAIDLGYRVESHESVGSTNALALERAAAGDFGKLWIAARRQEAGRGRRGRAWATPDGNLAATLLVVTGSASSHAATLGFVAGLSLADALEEAVPGRVVRVGPDGGTLDGGRFELKWPNDVLAGGAKLAGILLESMQTSKGFSIAVGVGVNVAVYPDDLPYPATSLNALGATCSAERLFEGLTEAWCRNSAVWDEGRGLDAIRRRWLERAAGLGCDVAVRLNGEVLRGTFETIDEDCRFVIRRPDGGVTKVAAGDVHFGAVASATAG